MNSMARILSISVLIALAAPLGLLHGCGNETSSAPDGSTIGINPGGTTWNTGSTTGCNGTEYNFSLFTISVNDSLGNPRDNTSIIIDLDLAPNTAAPGNQVMYLFDADAGYAVAVPYETKTGDFGTKNVKVFVDLGGCSYKGDLKVFSGTAFNSVSIAVTGP